MSASALSAPSIFDADACALDGVCAVRDPLGGTPGAPPLWAAKAAVGGVGRSADGMAELDGAFTGLKDAIC